MAKQTAKPTSPSTKKMNSSETTDSLSYLFRNFAVLAVLAVILFSVYNANSAQAGLQDMYQEFTQLRQTGGNQQRMQELYNRIVEIQNDTSYFKKITRGYYWAVHDLAIKGSENVDEMESKAVKPLTREDKLAMRVGIWPFIDYINKNTPPDAVLYLPDADSAMANNNKWNYIYDPEWMEYFIYPRLCVEIGHEKDHPDLAKRVTHVVIAEGKGYEKLKYEVPENNRPREAVLRIAQPPVQNSK
jgi:hypothetical protein